MDQASVITAVCWLTLGLALGIPAGSALTVGRIKKIQQDTNERFAKLLADVEKERQHRIAQALQRNDLPKQ